VNSEMTKIFDYRPMSTNPIELRLALFWSTFGQEMSINRVDTLGTSLASYVSMMTCWTTAFFYWYFLLVKSIIKDLLYIWFSISAYEIRCVTAQSGYSLHGIQSQKLKVDLVIFNTA
jgi:hypothetical protein